MSKTFFEQVREMALQMQDQRRAYLRAQYPLPPNYEEMSPGEQMDKYLNLTPEEMDRMLAEEGMPAMAAALVEMERRRKSSQTAKERGNGQT